MTKVNVVLRSDRKVVGKPLKRGDLLGTVEVAIEGLAPDTVCHALTNGIAAAVPADLVADGEEDDAVAETATSDEPSSQTPPAETPAFDPEASGKSPQEDAPEAEADKPAEKAPEQETDAKKPDEKAEADKPAEAKGKGQKGGQRKPPQMPKS